MISDLPEGSTTVCSAFELFQRHIDSGGCRCIAPIAIRTDSQQLGWLRGAEKTSSASAIVFRQMVKVLRWRPDKAPEQCTLEQLA
jgi:hypothetical protein